MTDLQPRPTAAYFPGLDAARALGAAVVVLAHCAFWTGNDTHGPLSAALARMDIGVALFFVLSGFLLFRPFALAQVHGRRWPLTSVYFRRRALRIVPAYWLLVVVALLSIPTNRHSVGVAGWLHQLTLTQIYGGNPSIDGLSQTWSLATEVLFYLLLPVLASVLLRGNPRPLLTLLAVIAVAPLWRLYLGFGNGVHADANLWLPGYLDWFGGGMMLALIQVQGPRPSTGDWRNHLRNAAQAPALCWGAALVLFALVSTPLAGPQGYVASSTSQDVIKNVLYGAIALLVVLPMVLRAPAAGPMDRFFASGPVRWLGETSYGVFLYHLLLLQAVTDVRHQPLFTGNLLETFLLVWGIALALASVSYLVLERPILRLKPWDRSAPPGGAGPVEQASSMS